MKHIPKGAPGRTPGRGVKPAEAGSLKSGAIVYFPVCHKTTKPQAQPYVFQGKGFGVFLGVTPHGFPDMTREMIPAMMAGIGWVSFEDVAELLGEEQLKLLEQKFRDKYEAKPGEEAAPAEPPKIALPQSAGKLIGLDGAPLSSDDQTNKKEMDS